MLPWESHTSQNPISYKETTFEDKFFMIHKCNKSYNDTCRDVPTNSTNVPTMPPMSKGTFSSQQSSSLSAQQKLSDPPGVSTVSQQLDCTEIRPHFPPYSLFEEHAWHSPCVVVGNQVNPNPMAKYTARQKPCICTAKIFSYWIINDVGSGWRCMIDEKLVANPRLKGSRPVLSAACMELHA